MKLMEEYTVPKYTGERQRALKCDICGCESPRRDSWAADSYDVNETTIERRTGCNYPDWYNAPTQYVNLCPPCFDEKLIPWLKEQGAEMHTDED